MHRCSDCGGRGALPSGGECLMCEGIGYLIKEGVPCTNCGGYSMGRRCIKCSNSGWEEAPVPLSLEYKVIRLKTLSEVFDKVLDGEYEDSYIYGVLAGIFIHSQDRTEAGGKPGSLILELTTKKSGNIIVLVDGLVEKLRGQTPARIVKFPEVS